MVQWKDYFFKLFIDDAIDEWVALSCIGITIAGSNPRGGSLEIDVHLVGNLSEISGNLGKSLEIPGNLRKS